MRYHVYTEARHPTGAVSAGHSLTVYDDAAGTELSDIYAAESGGSPLANPYVVPATGKVEFWVTVPKPYSDSGDGVLQPLSILVADPADIGATAIRAPAALHSLAALSGTNEDTASRICEHLGVVYVGSCWFQGGSELGGRVYSLDTTTGVLTLAFNTGEQSVRSLVSYRSTLYVGTGPGAQIYAWDGTTMTLAHAGVGDTSVICAGVYAGKLYMGGTDGALYCYDGETWSTLTTLPTPIEALAVFDGLLFAVCGNEDAGTSWTAYASDGTNTALVYATPSTNKHQALCVCPWRGCLYVSEYDPTGNASITKYDPATGTWTVIAVPNSPTALYSLAVYRDALYIGSHPNGELFRYDGGSVISVGTLTGVGSLRDLAVAGDRLLIAGRLSGSPSTGGPVWAHGDRGMQPARTNESPQQQKVVRRVDDTLVGTFDPRMAAAGLTVAVNNRAYYNRVVVRAPRYVTSLTTSVVTASGNICVAIYTNVSNAPAARIATSGSVACPAAGMRVVALTAGLWLLPGDYWFAIAADNTTASFNSLNPTIILSALSQFEDGAFPLPATATGIGGLSGRQYPLWIGA